MLFHPPRLDLRHARRSSTALVVVVELSPIFSFFWRCIYFTHSAKLTGSRSRLYTVVGHAARGLNSTNAPLSLSIPFSIFSFFLFFLFFYSIRFIFFAVFLLLISSPAFSWNRRLSGLFLYTDCTIIKTYFQRSADSSFSVY